jgi:hypothetical protein
MLTNLPPPSLSEPGMEEGTGTPQDTTRRAKGRICESTCKQATETT